MRTFFPDIFFKKRILWHLLFWIVATVDLSFAYKGKNDSMLHALFLSLIRLPGQIFFVYTILYYLIPKYALQKKFFRFFLWFISIGLICSAYMRAVDTLIFHTAEQFTDRRLLFRSVFASFNWCGIAVAIKLLKYWYNEREAKQQAEKISLNAQLELLKSQVHPHFLFNTLNNLYSLTMERSGQASMVVLKLSSLLRYMLYECNGNEISLEKEIDILRNYVELERMRYGERLDLSFTVSGNIGGKEIAPLLLFPLLENSFKHGASEQIDNCWIVLDIEVKENILYLKLTNSAPMVSQNNKGIGLQNVQQRLALLYKNMHNFKTTRTDESFTVSLELALKTPDQSV